MTPNSGQSREFYLVHHSAGHSDHKAFLQTPHTKGCTNRSVSSCAVVTAKPHQRYAGMNHDAGEKVEHTAL